MAKVAPARRVALALVSEARRRAGRMRELMRSSEAFSALDARDRSLASRLALGCVAARGFLDAQVSARVRKPSSVEPRVRDALALACFELCYLDTPTSAVVSQGVELVRSVQPRAAGMANAVLRRMVAELLPSVKDARERVVACGTGAQDAPCPTISTEDLALVSALPSWLLARIVAAYGAPAACAFALGQLGPAPVYVAANRARHSADETQGLLVSAGLEPEETALPSSFVLGNVAPLASSGLVQAADVVVSDLAAQLVARIAAPAPGERVLEIGQGRGTKSLLLESVALERGGLAQIVGVDSEAFKTGLAQKRMAVAGLADRVRCVTFDACDLAGDDLPEALRGTFDLVFVDAPCSGTGTMRRHPEIAWSLDEAAVKRGGTLPTLQGALLSAAAAKVRPGGALVYATCSVLPEENAAMIDAFLSSGLGASFEVQSVSDAAGVRTASPEARALVRDATDEHGFLQTLPRQGSCDGHFCARLVRR